MPATDPSPNLDHVLWLAGSPCGGKSTVSHLLTQIYVWVDYHADAWERAHFRRRIVRGDQEAEAALQQSVDERWLRPTVEDLVRSASRSWMQTFPLVIEDLQSFPRDNLILAEGIFFPEAVVPYLRHPHQALWLIPTPDFCRQARYRKSERLRERKQRHGIADEGSQPQQRLEKLIARDVGLADEMRQQAARFGVPWLEVDGTRSIDESLAVVEQFYDPFLKDYYSQR